MTCTILVVDDDHDVCRLLSRLLEMSGFTVLTANGGEQALAMLRMARVAVVLLDISMPGIDGIETLRRIRSNPDTADQRVVMYTALDLEEHRRQAATLQATDYWIKGKLDITAMEQQLRHLCAA